ncbi:MAG: methyltransferase type 12 [Rhodobacteraceae bacterium]|jgi:phospholipid N-methyltransferase|nr:methyltransferase type 12 [Paracoccaceae bacterium]
MFAVQQSDTVRFLKSWAGDPLRVAAVAPSSASLARAMTLEVDPARGPVVELGPGTGVFTRALLSRGVAERDLVLVEMDHAFRDLLAERHPEASVLALDATRLHRASGALGGRPAGAVVSGLPLLAMGTIRQMRVLRGAFALLGTGGAMYQFTYGPGCPVPGAMLRKLGLTAQRIGGTLRNIPPAAVWRFRRLQEDAAAGLPA